MTEASRQQHIITALASYNELTGVKDTLRIGFGSAPILPVIDVPLDFPILNAQSFRIGTQLDDHPNASVVRDDPESAQAQAIVTELVRSSHRNAEELKADLERGVQEQPGVITRKGKLINGNSRCVFMRELRDAGKTSLTTIRVGVLPLDFTNDQELELEFILQQQLDLKDEYNLPNELKMIKKLHEVAHMSDAMIARKQNEKGGAARITDLREVLVLMERARRLSTTTIPLSAFISKNDKKQNWLELLKDVRFLDANQGSSTADDHIRRWLVAYFTGHDSVHILRDSQGNWVEHYLVGDLAGGDNVEAAIAAVATTPTEPEPGEQDVDVQPEGLDFLGDESESAPAGGVAVVQRILDLTVAAKSAGEGEVTLPNGSKVPGPDIMVALHKNVKKGLDTVKRQKAAGNRMKRPAAAMGRAKDGLTDARDALYDILGDVGFPAIKADIVALVEDARVLLEDLENTLGLSETPAEAADV